MTRKDYVLIAQAIKGTIPGPEHTEDYLQGQAVGWANCARSIADALSTDNPRFDRARFLAACGVTR